MSQGITYLHSHSWLERELRFPKHIVLVDAEYKEIFENSLIPIEPFKHGGVIYYKVPILSFVYKGGVFKNLIK